MQHLQNLEGQISPNLRDLFYAQIWHPEILEKHLHNPSKGHCEKHLSLLLKCDCGPQQTLKVQTQKDGTTNRPVFYLAEHHLPLGMIGSVDWFCPCVVRTSRAEAATQLYWDAPRLWADAAQSQVKQTVAKLRTTRWPFLLMNASYVAVCMH